MSRTGPGSAGVYRQVGFGRPGPSNGPGFAAGFRGGPAVIGHRRPSLLHDQRQSCGHQSDANPDVGHVEHGRIRIDVDPIDDGPGVVAMWADCPVDQVGEAPTRGTAHEERRQPGRCVQGEHDQDGERQTLQQCDHRSVTSSEPERCPGVGDQPELDETAACARRRLSTQTGHRPDGTDQVGRKGECDAERHPGQPTAAAAAGPPRPTTVGATCHGCCRLPRLRRNNWDPRQLIVARHPTVDSMLEQSGISTEGAS